MLSRHARAVNRRPASPQTKRALSHMLQTPYSPNGPTPFRAHERAIDPSRGPDRDGKTGRAERPAAVALESRSVDDRTRRHLRDVGAFIRVPVDVTFYTAPIFTPAIGATIVNRLCTPIGTRS